MAAAASSEAEQGKGSEGVAERRGGAAAFSS